MDAIKRKEQDLEDRKRELRREKEQVALDIAKDLPFPTESLKEWFKTRVKSVEILTYSDYMASLPASGERELVRVSLFCTRVIWLSRKSALNAFWIAGLQLESLTGYNNMSGPDREFIQAVLPVKTDMDLVLWFACFEIFIAKYTELLEPQLVPIFSRALHRAFC